MNAAKGPKVPEEPQETPDDRVAREAAASAETQAFSDEDLAKLLAEAHAATDENRESEAPEASEGLGDENLQLAEERLNDLKRLQAEYQNYRRRVAERQVEVQEVALLETLRELVPVLDDLDRVEKAGDLDGSPLEAVAKKIRSTLEKMGLVKFGEIGEPFDPKHHEAIAKIPAADADGETIADVVEVGYEVGERLLRPAKVAVKVPQQ
ncbi:MAG: nucleotide exchange factor GrpE [Microbacteriaceae bacterium]